MNTLSLTLSLLFPTLPWAAHGFNLPIFNPPSWCLSTVWELGQLALRCLAWGLFLLPLCPLCKLWLRCLRQSRRQGLGASWGEGIKAFPAPWQRVEQRQGQEQVCFDGNTATFPLWLPSGKVVELCWDFLKESCFSWHSPKIDGKSGWSQGIWHHGNFSHQLVSVWQHHRSAFCWEKHLHQMFIWDSEIYSSEWWLPRVTAVLSNDCIVSQSIASS